MIPYLTQTAWYARDAPARIMMRGKLGHTRRCAPADAGAGNNVPLGNVESEWRVATPSATNWRPMDATDTAVRERQERLEAEALTHLDALYRTALRLSRSPQDAEDLVQETYLNAFRALDRFEEGTNLRAWLFRILNNAFISQYRRRKRRPSSSLDEVSDFYLYDHLVEANTAPAQENPEREVLSRIG